MNKRQADRWVKALLSGKFKQARGKLRTEDEAGNATGHCCLGVLAELNGCNIDISDSYLDGGREFTCGLSSEAGRTKDGSGIKVRIGNKVRNFVTLADANDKGASFRSIATWIKNNYKRL